jgi:GNAT superfamily N-acetyltransferase
MSVRIREAETGEEAAIVAMYQWLFDAPGSTPPQWDPERAAERLTEAIIAPQSSVFVADEDGDLVGFCTAYLDLNSVRFGHRCWVEDLAVDPQRRSRRTGKALLEAAKDWARGAGASHLELDSGLARTDAHRFYEREGAVRQSYSFGWEL